MSDDNSMIYYLNNFFIYYTAMLNIVIMLYITFLLAIITKFVLFDNLHLIHPPPPSIAGNHKSFSLSYGLLFLRFHT